MKKRELSTLATLGIGISIYFLIATIPVLIITKDKLRGELGLLVGALLAMGMAFHMNFVLTRAMYMEGNQTAYLAGNSIVRLLVVGAALAVTVVTGWANYFTMFAGLMSLKVATYLQPVIARIFTKQNKE